MSSKSLIRFLLLAAIAMSSAGQLRADPMTLTPTAIAEGFSLSTFAYNMPNTGGGGVGPVGIGFPSSGGVLFNDYATGNFYRVADVDGNDVSTLTPSASGYGGNTLTGLANSGGQMYVALQASDAVARISDNGALISTVANGFTANAGWGAGAATGLVTNPQNGHLFVSSPSSWGTGGVFDLNPSTGTYTTLVAGDSIDGLTITSDGSTIYGADTSQGRILGWNTTTGAVVYTGPQISGLDGSALGTGTLAGNIFVNDNYGNLWEVNLSSNAITQIGQDGSRGDFVTVDPNGTLLLTQTDRILRLSAPSGGGFGTATPEPGTLTLLGIGGAGLLSYAWRRRKQVSSAR